MNPLVKTCGGVRTGCDGQCELSYDEGEDETWMTLLGEVRWEQQTGVTGRGFHFDLNAPNIERGQGGSINQDNPYTFQKATDQSPIILRIDNPVTLEERQIAQEDYYGQWFYRVFAAACDLGICPDGFGPDYGIMQDGRAEIYVTWFFEEPAEPGWTALSDG